MRYQSTKTYGHDVGFSCAFRQWRANDSHCAYVHGYALAISVCFEANRLDEKNWVIDFGGLTDFKKELAEMFDHKTLIARDDPLLEWFRRGNEIGTVDLVIVDKVGCESFAEIVTTIAKVWLKKHGFSERVVVSSVTISEHGGNSASVRL